jgi:hypothetical protein
MTTRIAPHRTPGVFYISWQRTLAALGIALLVAAKLAAQEACGGPGASLGVTAYQCASCSFKHEMGRTIYGFNAEPVVTMVSPWSALRVGDVVEAVDGKPITTADGAGAFTYPLELPTVRSGGTGPLVIVDGTVRPRNLKIGVLVRRDGRSMAVDAPLREDCGGLFQSTYNLRLLLDSARTRIRAGGSGGRVGGRGTVTVRGDTMAVRLPDWTRSDSVLRRVITQLDVVRTNRGATGRFGFALTCTPSCTRTHARDGTEYWKFDGYPAVAEVREGSPAASAGVVVGDTVTAIDGQSILTDDGALSFRRNAQTAATLHVTVRRDGKEVEYLLTAPGGRGGRGKAP